MARPGVRPAWICAFAIWSMRAERTGVNATPVSALAGIPACARTQSVTAVAKTELRRPTSFLRRLPGEIQQRAKCSLIRNGELGKRLAVQRHPGLLEAVHENRIGEAFPPDRRIDSADPKRAEIPLSDAAVAKRVGQRLEQCFVCNAIVAAASRAKALDQLHHLAAMFETSNRAFNTCHSLRSPR